jgi:hypothetical protein
MENEARYDSMLSSCAFNTIDDDGIKTYTLEGAIEKKLWRYISIHYHTSDVLEKYKDHLYWSFIISQVRIDDIFFEKYKRYILQFADDILENMEFGKRHGQLSKKNIEILKKQVVLNRERIKAIRAARIPRPSDDYW